MKRVLVVALVISIGGNVWWFATSPSSEPYIEPADVADAARRADEVERERVARDPEPPVTIASDDESAGVREQLHAANERIAELESELNALDPLGRLLYSDKPIAWKAQRLLEIEDEKERNMSAWKLGRALGEKEESAQQLLDALRSESDPEILAIVSELIRAGGMSSAPEDVRRQFIDILRHGETPAHRAAAARAVFMNEAFRGGFGKEVQGFAKEMNAALVEAIRQEQSPEVIGGIANSLAAWTPTPDAVVALLEAAERLPESEGRRQTWQAIGRGTFLADRGASLFEAFDATDDPAERNDIAAGIARAGNSMGFSAARGENAEEELRVAQERVRRVFEGTTDADVRRQLARAALTGLSCLPANTRSDEGKANLGRFFRELAALEPESAQRERIESFATAIETDGWRGHDQFREHLYADD